MQVDALDHVIKNAIDVMVSSKYQIFEICESVRTERASLITELESVINDAKTTIEKVDHYELEYRRARVRLTEVSRDFKRFTEHDIQVAYEFATQMQTQLAMCREKEIYLKARRDDLQKRIKNVDKQLERAESVVSQVNVVLEYLSGDLNQVTRLLESAKNRQLLGLKIILAQEEERKRIAREIHDGLAQTMANVVLRTEIAERMLSKQAYNSVKDELVDLKGQVRGGIEEVRKIIFNLRPMALDDLGLIPALRKFVQDYEEKTRISTKFEVIGKEGRLPSGMEVAIYRLVQEAFSNVLKHAQASHVTLEVTFQQQMVKIVISDNGVGFVVDNIDKKIEKGSHYGLMGMRERVELLEGRMEFQSTLGAGTKVSLLIPIKLKSKEE
ncbi:sensor histidine kinase [Paenibacillus xerothermodurans]|uniref:Signal transduction histidine-protein kinase/phosphatase DegS n=1 Tax=Paenibacillus xerothermodurans TaxID=1977292 RepID=A0A2W1NWZ0_PAEXE|nr:sensor histidine kinase [Paenibacillus xerothermodurans]PZE19368.1 histidine kinase [Paenibacillus xerothermodurans]